jgi:hypothetical protein
MQEKPFTPLTPIESENWLKEHAGSWRPFMTVPRGFVFKCCGEVKTGGSNHEHDVMKTKKGWMHGSCKSGIVLMKYPPVMEKESNFRRWQTGEHERKEKRNMERERRPYFGG